MTQIVLGSRVPGDSMQRDRASNRLRTTRRQQLLSAVVAVLIAAAWLVAQYGTKHGALYGLLLAADIAFVVGLYHLTREFGKMFFVGLALVGVTGFFWVAVRYGLAYGVGFAVLVEFLWGFLGLTRQFRALFGVALLVIVAGFVLLAIPPAEGFWSLTAAPIVLVLGYCVLIPIALLRKPKPRVADAAELADHVDPKPAAKN